MSTHSSILAWEIPWTEEPGGLYSMGLQRAGHNLVTKNSNKNVVSCFFILLFHGILKARMLNDLPFPSPVKHILS